MLVAGTGKRGNGEVTVKGHRVIVTQQVLELAVQDIVPIANNTVYLKFATKLNLMSRFLLLKIIIIIRRRTTTTTIKRELGESSGGDGYACVLDGGDGFKDGCTDSQIR